MIETATMKCGQIVLWGVDDEIAVVMILIVLVMVHLCCVGGWFKRTLSLVIAPYFIFYLCTFRIFCVACNFLTMDKPMGASPRSAFSTRDIVNPACGQFLLNIVGSGSHVTWLFSICDPSQA